MTLTQTVDISEDRRIIFEVPREIPIGKTDVVIQFPVREKAQPEAAAAEKPKMHIPKNSEGKFILTKEVIDKMLQNSPHTRALSGILSGMVDVDLDKARMERLAKHL